MTTMTQKIDVTRLVAAIASNAEEIRVIKKVLRTRWPEGQDMAPTQWELLKLQARATELCILRARMRGRHHLRIAPRSYRDSGTVWDQERYHAKIAERMAEEFRAAEPEPTMLAG